MERLIIGVPSTFTSVDSRKLRTHIIGRIARFFGIFRVTHVFVYYDKDPKFDSHALGKYIVKVLKYAVTPPPLKKFAFPYSEEYKDFGYIAPLQIRSHFKDRVGRFQWGVVTEEGRLVYLKRGKISRKRIDLDRLRREGYSLNLPQLVVLENEKIVSPLRLNRREYIGFWARYFNRGLHSMIEFCKKNFDVFVIGTSRKGKYFREVEEEIIENSDKDFLIVFGSAHRGISNMEGFREEDYDVILNLFKDQETKTIRTEEAIPLVLELLNVLLES